MLGRGAVSGCVTMNAPDGARCLRGNHHCIYLDGIPLKRSRAGEVQKVGVLVAPAAPRLGCGVDASAAGEPDPYAHR